eukprot:1129711-Heterocapsa_arctica.AAC.1
MMIDALNKVMTLAHVQNFGDEPAWHLMEPLRFHGHDLDDGGGHSKEQSRARRALKRSGMHAVLIGCLTVAQVTLSD